MSKNLQETITSDVPLGQKTPYPKGYDKNLLFPIQRALQREAMGFPNHVQFKGYDVWNAYELFWLNKKGKPIRSHASFVIPAESPFIAESKSVKLYLNSLNHEQFVDVDEVAQVITKDLSQIFQAQVKVMMAADECAHLVLAPKYRCLDELDISITHYNRAPELLRADKSHVNEQRLMTHLFKSHCLCTGQPDLGSIFIDYVGPKIDEESLLAYLVSYRDHAGFAENCIEQIYVDLIERVSPQKLTVFGRFTRRGGIDINPYRSTHEIAFDNTRLLWQ